MNIRFLSLIAALACATLPCIAMAQSTTPASGTAAWAPSAAAKPGPKQLSPEQARDSATTPGELRPEHPVVPQINIPLGKQPPVPPKSPASAARSGRAASAGGIDDAVARCEAQVDRQARADCRARLARQGRKG